MKDNFEQLRENKAHMTALFASKGWEIWLEWAAGQVQRDFEEAIHGETAEKREAARVAGVALERFVRVPFFLSEQLGIAQAEGASPDSQVTTPEAE